MKGNDERARQHRRHLNGLRTWDELNARTSTPEQRWVSQEYIDTLVSFGEWRCFLVGGHVINVVHTLKLDDDDTWLGQRVWQFRSLAEIRYVARGSQ